MSTTPTTLSKLRHLYENMVNGGVRDTASAKRIAEGLLSPAIAELERAALTQGAGGSISSHIKQPYTLAEIRAKIASHDYSAELLLQHAMLLLEGAGAVEPVAHLWRNVIDGRTRVVMPDSIITADASWVVEDSLHTATQLQQAVAQEREECAKLCEAVAVRWGHHQVAPSAAHNCAAAIRSKGTHD